MDHNKQIELASGESLFFQAFEITQIPDVTIIKGDTSNINAVEDEYRKEFGGLLTEIFQNYLSIIEIDKNSEISIELLFLTESVKNQPYSAGIRIFL